MWCLHKSPRSSPSQFLIDSAFRGLRLPEVVPGWRVLWAEPSFGAAFRPPEEARQAIVKKACGTPKSYWRGQRVPQRVEAWLSESGAKLGKSLIHRTPITYYIG
jgi:hypothetical protein